METINMQCLKYIEVYAESYLSGRAYIGEMLIQIWLTSMKK